MSQPEVDRAPIEVLFSKIRTRFSRKEVVASPTAVVEAPTRRPIAPVVVENHPADPFEPLQASLDEINDAKQYYDGMNTTLLGIANAAMITRDPAIKCTALVAMGHGLIVSYDGIQQKQITNLKLGVIKDIVAVTTTTKDVRVYKQAIEVLTPPFMQYNLDITNKDLTKGAVDAVYAIGDLHREARDAAIHSLNVALKFQGDQEHPRVDLSRVRKARTLLLSRKSIK